MVDLSGFSVKELSNEGVGFKLMDDFGIIVEAGEEVPIDFVLYGADAKKVSKARAVYNAVLEIKNVKPHKKEAASMVFIGACVKSWTDFKYAGGDVVNGDVNALTAFLEDCPMFRDQIIEFVFEREHFLAR